MWGCFMKRRIVAGVLPTEWESAPKQLAQLYALEQPRLALHFGVSERARGFVLETRGRNECRDAPDARGARPLSRCISESAPESLDVSIPAKRIVARLTALGIPAGLSDDAGAYLCNAVLFHALRLAEAEQGPRVGFIHIPPRISDRAAARTLDWDTAMAGGLEIIRVCLGLRELARQR